jgi:hypothetical protein
MNIRISRKAAETASVFIIAMCMIAVFAVVLGSYLTLVSGQADAVSRSQNYETAIPVAESGVEEALALLNKNYPNIVSTVAWTNNLTSDGWSSMTSSNTTTKSNSVASGNYYYVTISNGVGSAPTITSAGVVPFIEHAWAATSAGNTNYSATTVALVRTLQVQTTSQSLFSDAISAKGDITFSGGANVDSFNSANTNWSVNGQYSPTKVHDQARVGTDGKLTAAIRGSGVVTIRGYVNTGPGGTVGTTGNTSIGDNNWVSNSTVGIEASRSNDNFNVTFPDISAPTGTYFEVPSPGIVGGTNYTMVFEGSQFWGTSNVMYETSISMSGQQKAIVTGGAVTIYIPSSGSFGNSGQAFIYVAPGSSVSIYCAASSASLSGNSFAGATNAEDIAFYGLPTCTSVSYSGNASYIGTIYAPEADFSSSGNGAVIGALMANTFSFSGNATVHYDENLGKIGPSTGFVATNWQEIVTPISYQELPP